jgi:leishmanolysin
MSLGAQGLRKNTNERMHIVRRLYGPENADVRREVSKLEERIDRYQTGFPPSDHSVPYEDHPYDPETKKKRLLQSSNDTSTTTERSENFKPIRIFFYTDALDNIRDSSNAAKIDWYKNVILPKTAEFWSQALSVIPVSGRLRVSSTELDGFSYCGDSDFTEVPNDHKSDGVANTDLILYVSGSDSQRFCPSRTLAVAVPCNFDQFDRPTAGAINVCLDNIELNEDGTATSDVVKDYVDVTIHEVGHVLGHSSNSYRFYWDPETGEPRTSRPFSSRTVTCVDGTSRSLILPSDNTMKFFDDDGRRFASIVTPKVRAVARNQFDCQSLEGAQLENQPTRAESCAGDHWDERLYYPEALSGVISPTANILSSLTLALMEDSGWYKANYTSSRMSPWGLGSGCSFVNQPCLTQGTSGGTEVPSYGRGFFCNSGEEKGCSSEHTHKMACTIIDYYYFVPQTLPDVQYQYFPDAPSKGVSDDQSVSIRSLLWLCWIQSQIHLFDVWHF